MVRAAAARAEPCWGRSVSAPAGKRVRGKQPAGTAIRIDLSSGAGVGLELHMVAIRKVAVKTVKPGGPGDLAGIRPGMRVFRVGGNPVQACRLAERLFQSAAAAKGVVVVTVGDPEDSQDVEGADVGSDTSLLAARVPLPADGDGGALAGPGAERGGPGAGPMLVDVPGVLDLRCPVGSCRHEPEPGQWVMSGRSISRAFRDHLDDHLADDPGVLSMLRSEGWLEQFRVDQCGVCGLLAAGPGGSVHPGPCERRLAHRTQVPRADPGVDEFALGFPSLREVHARQVRVRQSVPGALRFLWIKALHLTVSEVVLFSLPSPNPATAEGMRCHRVWVQLAMLAKACLCSPPRGGGRRQRQSLQFTRRRIEAWLEGPEARLRLWDSLPKQPTGKRLDPGSDEARERRAERLAADGRLGDAFKALCDPVPLPPGAERLAQMRAKHPAPQRGSGVDSAAPAPPTWEFDGRDVVEQLRRFPRGTAAGPSGLSVQHILDVLGQADAETFAGRLAALVNILARGDAPRAVARHLAGAKLVALPKPSNGLRPVAVGETVRRLVARCLCAKARSRIAEELAPYQFGVGVAGGGEALVHGLRQWWERASQETDGKARVALCLDFENAFNRIERDVFIPACRRVCPELVGFVEYCYAEETELLFSGSPVASRTGVQQGDPLGPLLFCVALHELLAQAAAE
eukprot:Hpha_TRINITY_DN14185_c0_g1::TRINITY_DN14185_c0_g1_i1::g.11004::m.11004